MMLLLDVLGWASGWAHVPPTSRELARSRQRTAVNSDVARATGGVRPGEQRPGPHRKLEADHEQLRGGVPRPTRPHPPPRARTRNGVPGSPGWARRSPIPATGRRDPHPARRQQPGKSRVLTGYMVITAADLDAAARLAGGFPGLAHDVSVEVAEVIGFLTTRSRMSRPTEKEARAMSEYMLFIWDGAQPGNAPNRGWWRRRWPRTRVHRRARAGAARRQQAAPQPASTSLRAGADGTVAVSRRPVRRDQGGPGRLLPDRGGRPRPGPRDRQGGAQRRSAASRSGRS